MNAYHSPIANSTFLFFFHLSADTTGNKRAAPAANQISRQELDQKNNPQKSSASASKEL